MKARIIAGYMRNIRETFEGVFNGSQNARSSFRLFPQEFSIVCTTEENWRVKQTTPPFVWQIATRPCCSELTHYECPLKSRGTSSHESGVLQTCGH